MTFDHVVKFNGKYYAAGEEVLENEEPLPFADTGLEEVGIEEERPAAKSGPGKKTNPENGLFSVFSGV